MLLELGFPQLGPTVIHEDNQAVINMVNNSKPATRARHVDVQFFVIQEWRARKEIKLEYIADGATKALGWTLHSRHARRAMGHHRPAYAR